MLQLCVTTSTAWALGNNSNNINTSNRRSSQHRYQQYRYQQRATSEILLFAAMGNEEEEPTSLTSTSTNVAVTARATATAPTPTNHPFNYDEEHSNTNINSNSDSDINPTNLEGRLLSAHAALKSFLSEEPQPRPTIILPTSSSPSLQAQADSKKRRRESVYKFNKVLVDTIYSTIGEVYHPSLKTTRPFSFAASTASLLSRLLPGTEFEHEREYNDNEMESAILLRFEQFYVLATVARMPYFAYLSVMHLKETFGDRGAASAARLEIHNKDNSIVTNNNDDNDHNKIRSHSSSTSTSSNACDQRNLQRIDKMRTHYAQADNKSHHLHIMGELALSESSSGNANTHTSSNADTVRVNVMDHFVAQCLAFVYYWFVAGVFLWNEQAAYHLSEVFEDRAVRAYDEFLALHELELRVRSVPESAKKYYENDYEKDPFLFDTFCAVADEYGTNTPLQQQEADLSGSNSINNDRDGIQQRRRRPYPLLSLYDVFRNVRDDEKEHWMSLCNLVQYDDLAAVDSGHVQSTEASNKNNSNNHKQNKK